MRQIFLSVVFNVAFAFVNSEVKFIECSQCPGQCLVHDECVNIPEFECKGKFKWCEVVKPAKIVILAPWTCDAGSQTGFTRMQLNAQGEIQCFSYDSINCKWHDRLQDCIAISEPIQEVRPLECGEMHRRIYGTTGYETKGHWCQRGRQILGPHKPTTNTPSLRPKVTTVTPVPTPSPTSIATILTPEKTPLPTSITTTFTPVPTPSPASIATTFTPEPTPLPTSNAITLTPEPTSSPILIATTVAPAPTPLHTPTTTTFTVVPAPTLTPTSTTLKPLQSPPPAPNMTTMTEEPTSSPTKNSTMVPPSTAPLASPGPTIAVPSVTSSPPVMRTPLPQVTSSSLSVEPTLTPGASSWSRSPSPSSLNKPTQAPDAREKPLSPPPIVRLLPQPVSSSTNMQSTDTPNTESLVTSDADESASGANAHSPDINASDNNLSANNGEGNIDSVKVNSSQISGSGGLAGEHSGTTSLNIESAINLLGNDDEVNKASRIVFNALVGGTIGVMMIFHFTAMDPSSLAGVDSSSGIGPNLWELPTFITFMQNVAIVAMASIDSPYEPFALFTDSFSWLLFLPKGSGVRSTDPSVQSRRLEAVESSNTSQNPFGIQQYAYRLHMKEEDLFPRAITCFGVVISTLLLLILLSCLVTKELTRRSSINLTNKNSAAVAARIRGLGQKMQGGMVFILSQAVLPLTAVSFFGATASSNELPGFSSGMGMAALIILFIIAFACIGTSITLHTRSEDVLSKNEIKSTYGILYVNHKYSLRAFCGVTLVVQFLSGIFTSGFASSSTQMIGLIVIHAVYLMVIFLVRPHLARFNFIVSLSVEGVNIAIYALCYAQARAAPDDLDTKKVLGYVVMGLVGCLVILFFARTLMRLCKKFTMCGKDLKRDSVGSDLACDTMISINSSTPESKDSPTRASYVVPHSPRIKGNTSDANPGK